MTDYVRDVTPDEVWERIEALAQRELHCSADEALRKVDAGELDGFALAPHLRMLRELATAEPAPVAAE